jgi:hypothetical protein
LNEDEDKVGRRELTVRMRCQSMKCGLRSKGLDEGEKHRTARVLDGSLIREKHHRCSHLTRRGFGTTFCIKRREASYKREEGMGVLSCHTSP